jgi:hypothetical protein
MRQWKISNGNNSHACKIHNVYEMAVSYVAADVRVYFV